MTNIKDVYYYRANKGNGIEENDFMVDGENCNCFIMFMRCLNNLPGRIANFADFYALIPPNDMMGIAPGEDVGFPQNGPIGGTGITRLSDTAFNLANIGTYQIFFEVSINESGQLLLTLNGTDLDYTVVGRATGTSQIVGMTLVRTTVANSVLTVRNPLGNNTLTLTPNAGGERAVSTHLVITQIN